MEKLSLLIITEEDQFYLPLVVRYIAENCKHRIEGVLCLENPTTASLLKTFMRFLNTFGVLLLIKHAVRSTKAKLFDLFPIVNYTKKLYSIRAVSKKYGIEYKNIKDVNNEKVINYIKDKKIDLIVSVSPTQIFREKLLGSVTYGCINIHSSLLPKYRGLYPVYWAMASGEEEVGVSIHYIEKKIDAGDVIQQQSFKLHGIKTMDEALIKAKKLGAMLMMQAINDIASKSEVKVKIKINEGSYYSFPDRKSYLSFRKNGYSLW